MNTTHRQLAAIGAALEYPNSEWNTRLENLTRLFAGHPAAAHVARFEAAVERYSDATISEVYTRTFDLAPLCPPYVGVHVFGEQDARRSQLLVGLASEYEAAGFDRRGELPDHLAVVLQALPMLSAQTCDELMQLCVRPALVSMAKQLHQGASLYEHLVQAVASVLDAHASERAALQEVTHA